MHHPSRYVSDCYSDADLPAAAADGRTSTAPMIMPRQSTDVNAAATAPTTALTTGSNDTDTDTGRPPDRYRRAIAQIAARCAALSSDNDRLVHRLHFVKRITRGKLRDVALLKRHLDEYGDGWRTAQPDEPLQMMVRMRMNDEVDGQQDRAVPAARMLIPTAVLSTSSTTNDGRVVGRKKYVKRKKSELQTPLLLTSTSETVVAKLADNRTMPQQNPPFVANIPAARQIDVQPAGLAHVSLSAVADIRSELPDGSSAQGSLQPQLAQQHSINIDSIIEDVATSRPTADAVQAELTRLVPPAPATETTTTSKRKRPRGEREKDPNAPKRPANPFFQFCQEQRSLLMGELTKQLKPGEPELSKQELTRQLAQRWRALDTAGKQIYITMYEGSKKKYNEEMQIYRDGGLGGGSYYMKRRKTVDRVN